MTRELLQPFSTEAQTLQLGTYEHYQGKRYQVLGVARHSETLEEMVLYKQMHGDEACWVRPLKMFLENVSIGNQQIPRFRYVGVS